MVWETVLEKIVPEKNLRPVSEKFRPEADFFAKISEFRRFIRGIVTGTGNFEFVLVVSEPVSEKFDTGKKSQNWHW